MANEPTFICNSSSAEETKRCAAVLARHLHAGDVVVLTGDLGAGKTQFVQGVADGLGIAATVTSPTFNILLAYEGGVLPLNHFDLYRLDEAEQLDDIGFFEVLEGDGATFVEWGEKFPEELPDDLLAIIVEVGAGSQRAIAACASGPRSEELLAGWVGELR